MKKKWTVYIINHSHTDIGYTDRQEKIERYHVDFIKQVISIFDSIKTRECKEWDGFKWTCENYWQVENFLKNADEENIKKFKKYVKEGLIDISLNYLNMTELVDEDILKDMISNARKFSDINGFELDSAMIADINGLSWGYSEVLHEQGVNNLFSCLHAHHGLAPLYVKQMPFWWETPKGNKILVWNGEHYMLGNEFFLVPNTRSSYHIIDEFVNDNYTPHFEVTENRLFRYVSYLEEEGYPYDYVPAMISGILSDNSPANPRIMEIINKWNEKYSDKIELKMTTLNGFFKIVRKENDIQTYSGDWNDWWADGVGSTPAPTKIYKDAQRKYHLSKKLDPKNELGKNELLDEFKYKMMMYAEHTWGYSSSVSEPWNTLVNDLDYRKAAYAVNSNQLISRHVDEILANLGEVSIMPDREKIYKIINPHDHKITDSVKVYVEHWEDIDGVYFGENLESRMEVIDIASGEKIDYQVIQTARANEIEFILSLHPKEEKLIRLQKTEFKPSTALRYVYKGSEGVQDIEETPYMQRGNNSYIVQNDYFYIEFDNKSGIKSLKYKNTDKELIHPNSEYSPFVGIYEKTDIRTNPTQERRIMGRNRKGRMVQRDDSKLTDIKIIKDGSVYTTIKLDYKLLGTQMYSVILKVFKKIPKISSIIRIQKQNEWAPENLYVSLPFSLGEDTELFIDKTGCIIRPGIDQLPGTNTEFYLTQNGMVYKNQEESLIVACKDVPLITLGELDSHIIKLCGESTAYKNKEVAYSWVMNNYWETNFKVDLSGFYEFEYLLYYTESQDEVSLFEKCKELSQGLVSFPCKLEK